MIGGHREPGMKLGESFVTAGQRFGLSAFDIHLNEIHTRQVQLRNKLIDRRHR